MITGINHITLAIQDIDRSFSFYKELLGLKPLVKWDQGAYFFAGEKNSLQPGAGIWFCLNVDPARQANPCYTHYAFHVSVDNFELMVTRLMAAKVPLFQENSSPGRSLYFLDPDGHKLELHAGTVEERLSAKKAHLGSWKNVIWYDA